MTNKFPVCLTLLLTFLGLCHSNEVLKTDNNDIPCDEKNECCSLQCLKAANTIKESMNTSVEPCNDFYEFVCGRYQNNVTIDNEQQYMSRFKEMQRFVNETFIKILVTPMEKEPTEKKVMRQFYSSCMREEEINKESRVKLLETLDSLGGWPVLSEKWSDEGYSLYQQLVNATLLGPQKAFLFNIDLNKYYIYLQSFIPILEWNDLCGGMNNSNVRAYHDYMVAVVTALGGEKSTAIKDMLEVVELEYNIAKIYCYSSKPNLTNFIGDIIKLQNENGGIEVSEEEMKSHYLDVKFEELDTKFPGFPWSKFMNVTLADFYTVKKNDVIVLPRPFGIFWTAVMINSVSNRTLSNLVLWRTVHNLIPGLSAKMREIRFNFSASIGRNDDMYEARPFQCLNLLRTSFSGVLVSSFFDDLFTTNYKMKAEDLMAKMQTQLIKNVQNISWISESERKHAVEKAKAIRNKLIIPDQIENFEPTVRALQKMKLDNLSFVESLMKLSRFDVIRTKTNRRMGVKNEKKDLFGGLGEAMEFYSLLHKTMDIPTGYLMDVLFNMNRTTYLDFGGIGMKIGHCFGHIYDSKGIWYSYAGWDETTEKKQKNIMDCLEKQYSNITVEQIGMKINGARTLLENFADNFAVNVTYEAFIRWSNESVFHKRLPGLPYTWQQMFWIQFASANCEKLSNNYAIYETTKAFIVPKKYRVNTPLGNSLQFRKDWNCSAQTKIGSQKICDVW